MRSRISHATTHSNSFTGRRLEPEVTQASAAGANPRYGFRKASVLNALWIPLSIQDTALMAIAVPAALLRLDPDNHLRALALLASAVAAVSMVIPPLAG